MVYDNIGEPSIPNSFWNLPFDILNALLTPPVSIYVGAAIIFGFLYYVYSRLAVGPRPE